MTSAVDDDDDDDVNNKPRTIYLYNYRIILGLQKNTVRYFYRYLGVNEKDESGNLMHLGFRYIVVHYFCKFRDILEFSFQ